MENYQCGIVNKVYGSAESSSPASVRALNLPSLFWVVHALPQDLAAHEATAKTGRWDGTISLCLADKSGTFAKRQALSDKGHLPDHAECHILSVVSGILVGGVEADG